MAKRDLGTIKIVAALLVVTAFMLTATIVIADGGTQPPPPPPPSVYHETSERTVMVTGLRSNSEGSARFDTICSDSYVPIDRSREYAHRQLLSALERGKPITVSFEHTVGDEQDCHSIGGVTSEAAHYAD